MEKRNVCLLNDSFPPVIDGVSTAVCNYAQIISKDLGRAAVVTPYYPDADDAVYPFPVYRYPSLDLTKQVGYRAGMPFAPELMKKLEGEGFDLLHSHCPVSATVVARMLRERINVPLVMTYHTKFDIDIAKAVRGKLIQTEAIRLLVKNISACDEVWTVSRGAGENLRKLGFERDYVVMPNGVDFPRGRVSDALVEEVTGAYDLPTELPLFLYVGRMMWYKGIRITLDALKTLHEEQWDFRMVFVGSGTDREEIVRYCKDLGLDSKVIFVDAIHDRDRVRAWYCRADLFLFPSTFDTNGLVVREAAACGLPSVLVEGSCAAEDSTDGQNSFLIQENAESMAAMLRILLRSRETLRRVGNAAREELYISWSDAVKQAYERYGTVIENYHSGLYPPHEGLIEDLLRPVWKLGEELTSIRETVRDNLDSFYNL